MGKKWLETVLRSGLVLIGLAALASPSAAQTPAPVYFVVTPDAVTGDNPTVSWPGRINGIQCGPTSGCILPDANTATGIDSYAEDVYERPTAIGQGSQVAYYPQIDIVSSSVGYDDDFLYYRFTLYGGSLTAKYGFEINFDTDDVGDMFIEVDDPADKVAGTWVSDHIQAYLDTNNSVGGANQLEAEGPGNIDGYEDKIYQTGNNQFPGAPGGNDVIVARSTGVILELAVSRVFLTAVNGGTPVEKAAFRPLATTTSFNEGSYYIHDEYSRAQIGSPYPWLSQPGAPASCPTGSDASLTATELSALEAGVDTVTVYLNPCFPASAENSLDIGGSVQDFSEPALQFFVDIAAQKLASQDSVSVGDTLIYTVSAFNLTAGAGQATGVVITDTVPTELTLLSANPSSGTCTGDPIVVCDVGQVTNGQFASVDIITSANTTTNTLFNRGWVVANETDTLNLNDSASVSGIVVYNGATSVVGDGVDTLPRLPSNGTSYPYVFEVSHTYSSNKDVVLHAFPIGGGVVSVDSITGTNVVAGATPDSATLVSRPRNAQDQVTVWLNVADVDRGLTDDVQLNGAVLSLPTSDSGFVAVEVIRPVLDLLKTALPTVGVTPGTDVTYNIQLINNGDANAQSVILMDSLPEQISFKIGSIVETFPAGVTAVREFTSDTGPMPDWNYSPTSMGCGAPAGYDGCITRIRWTFQNALPDTTSTPGAQTSVQFVTRVN